MKKYLFNSKIKIHDGILPSFTDEQIKNEPMIWRATGKWAYEHGGIITRTFLNEIKKVRGDYENCICDSRSHMHMKNWYPAIPGYHHDTVPRTRSDKQPNYDTPEYKANHIMTLINGDCCPTQFAIGECELEEVPLNEIVYKIWHEKIIELLNDKKLKLMNIPTNKLIEFDYQAFHQAQKAVNRGWRWFGRATFNTTVEPANEIRQQVQVYLENLMEGW